MLAAALRAARGHRTQAEFAKMLGLSSQQAYANYEAGRLPRSRKVLVQIANKLGLDPDTILTTSGQRSDVVSDAAASRADAAAALRHVADKALREALSKATLAHDWAAVSAIGAELATRPSEPVVSGFTYAKPERTPR